MPNILKQALCCILVLCSFVFLPHVFSLPIPEKPTSYVNDYAHLLSVDAKRKLEDILSAFEKGTSNQVVIATFESLEGESLEDYSIRLAGKWKIGTKKNDNGVILLVFKKEHEIRIEVGYGLEGTLPDAICSQIIRYEIVPFFKSRDFDNGILNGVNAIVKATSGEYSSENLINNRLEHSKYLLLIALFLYIVFPIFAFVFVIFLCLQLFGYPFGLLAGILITLILAIIRKLFFSSLLGETFYSAGRGFGGGDFWGGGFSGGFGGGGGSFGGGGASGRW